MALTANEDASFYYAKPTDVYLANQVDVTPHVQGGTLEVSMSDVWVGCILPNRFVVRGLHACSVRDANVESRPPNQEFTVPKCWTCSVSGLIHRLAGGRRTSAELLGGRT